MNKLQRKRIVAQEVLENIDDSKDGINLLLKKTNIETSKQSSGLNFLQAVKKTDPSSKFSFSKSEFFKAEADPKAVSSVKGEVNGQDKYHSTKELDMIIDETSRKRSLLFEEEQNSKRPKIEVSKRVSRKNRTLFAKSVGVLDWGSLEESKSVSVTMSLNFSKQNEKEEDKENVVPVKDDKVEDIQPIDPGFHPKQKLTAQRLAKRENQIEIGKATKGYENYTKFLENDKKPKLDDVEYRQYVDKLLLRDNGRRNTIKKDLYSVDVFPITPRKTVEISKRQWDVVVRRWRRSLHMYDDVTTKEQFQMVTKATKDQLKTKVAKFKRKGKVPVRNGFGYKKKQ